MKPEVKKILTKLSERKVNLSLIDDVESSFDKGLSDIKRIEKILRKAATDLNQASGSFDRSSSLASKGIDKAKEIGATDIINMLEVRKRDAEDFADAMRKASDDVMNAINEL
jgi:hypothetical protein